MTESPARPRRFAKLLRILVPLAVIGIILLSVSAVGFVEYSAQPGFCKGCHNMVPYYDSWTNSSHRDVPCIKCHYAPGIKAEAMGKLQAANQVVKYLTGSYGTRPWAEVDDAACLRSGCHSERKVEGAVDYNGVKFEHSKHLGELRRGKQLRCTSCHSQIVQGNHLAVTPSTCFLCHFKDRPAGAPIGGCIGCHPSPAKIASKDGYVVEHARYVADRVSCVSCHSDVTSGNGAADQARCWSCHNEPERIKEFDKPARIHQIHITDHKIECDQCHTPIEHRVVTISAAIELDCKSCHAKSHDAQLRLYSGTGGNDTRTEPSKMFLARVSCLGCHEQTAKVRGHERVKVAGEASCLGCHGIKYASILPSWQKEMALRVGRVAPVIARVRAALDAAGSARRPVADSLLRLAEENLALVQLGKPAHNVAFADQLLVASIELARKAVKAGNLSVVVPALDLGSRVTETSCSACHLGVERKTVPFKVGGVFPHEPHVVRGGLSCSQCHTPFDEHGGTRITAKAACQSCHHGAAQKLECSSCHSNGTTITKHADIAEDVHAAEPPCAACHDHAAKITKWSRALCTTCHVAQATGHMEEDSRGPNGCADCHDPKDIKPTQKAAAPKKP